MTTSLATSLLLPDFGSQTIVASVLGADSTATTYVLNCPPGTDSNDCGIYNQSLTLGPWASSTEVSGEPTTGAFDMYVTADYEEPWEFSVHCEMTRTVADECTIINNGGNNDGTPTVTATRGDDVLAALGFATMSYFPVTITAGLDRLEEGGGEGSASATGDASGDASATGQPSSGADDNGNAAGPRFSFSLLGAFASVVLVGAAVLI